MISGLFFLSRLSIRFNPFSPILSNFFLTFCGVFVVFFGRFHSTVASQSQNSGARIACCDFVDVTVAFAVDVDDVGLKCRYRFFVGLVWRFCARLWLALLL